YHTSHSPPPHLAPHSFPTRRSSDLVDAATRVAARDMTAKYDAFNPIALKKLVADKTQLKAFPKDVMDAGFKASMEVFAEHEAKSPEFKEIHQDMRTFQRDQLLWERFSELR